MTVITTNSEYITIEEALELITTHRYKTTGRYKRLENYFIGKHDILNARWKMPQSLIIRSLPTCLATL